MQIAFSILFCVAHLSIFMRHPNNRNRFYGGERERRNERGQFSDDVRTFDDSSREFCVSGDFSDNVWIFDILSLFLAKAVMSSKHGSRFFERIFFEKPVKGQEQEIPFIMTGKQISNHLLRTNFNCFIVRLGEQTLQPTASPPDTPMLLWFNFAFYQITTHTSDFSFQHKTELRL